MSFSTREYVYQMALFVCLIVLVVLSSYKFTYTPQKEMIAQLEDVLLECHRCERVIERIDCALYDPDCTEPIQGDYFDKYVSDMDSIGDLLDVKVKLIKVKIIEVLASLHKSSSHIS